MPSGERLAALDECRIDLIMAGDGLDEDALGAKGYDVYWFAQMPVVLAINTDDNRMKAITIAAEVQTRERSGELAQPSWIPRGLSV